MRKDYQEFEQSKESNNECIPWSWLTAILHVMSSRTWIPTFQSSFFNSPFSASLLFFLRRHVTIPLTVFRLIVDYYQFINIILSFIINGHLINASFVGYSMPFRILSFRGKCELSSLRDFSVEHKVGNFVSEIFNFLYIFFSFFLPIRTIV